MSVLLLLLPPPPPPTYVRTGAQLHVRTGAESLMAEQGQDRHGDTLSMSEQMPGQMF